MCETGGQDFFIWIETRDDTVRPIRLCNPVPRTTMQHKTNNAKTSGGEKRKRVKTNGKRRKKTENHLFPPRQGGGTGRKKTEKDGKPFVSAAPRRRKRTIKRRLLFDCCVTLVCMHLCLAKLDHASCRDELRGLSEQRLSVQLPKQGSVDQRSSIWHKIHVFFVLG